MVAEGDTLVSEWGSYHMLVEKRVREGGEQTMETMGDGDGKMQKKAKSRDGDGGFIRSTVFTRGEKHTLKSTKQQKRSEKRLGCKGLWHMRAHERGRRKWETKEGATALF